MAVMGDVEGKEKELGEEGDEGKVKGEQRIDEGEID